MKFILPLFLSALFVGSASGALDPNKFKLVALGDSVIDEFPLDTSTQCTNNPTACSCGTSAANQCTCGGTSLPKCTGFTQTNADTINVKFAHGAGSSGNTGETVQLVTVGVCSDDDGANFPTQNDNGLDVTTPNVLEVTPPTSSTGGTYTSEYNLKVDLGSDQLALDATDINNAEIVLCVTHAFVDETVSSGTTTSTVVNFQQTELTLKYDLEDDTIDSFTFQTVVSDALEEEFKTIIPAVATFCSAPTLKYQGEIVCFKVCPDSSVDLGNDFKVTTLKEVQAALDGSSTVQILTDDNGDETDEDQVDVSVDTGDTDCLKLEFLLGAAFFLSLPPDDLATTSQDESQSTITLTGTALMEDKEVAGGTTRRLASNSRALQSATVAESEFELDVQLARPEGTSGSVTATVTRFALVGAAGAAILI